MAEPDLHTARTAYDEVATGYVDTFKDTLDDRPVERGLLAAFAELVRHDPAGPVVDLGCGPGHIAAHLQGLYDHRVTGAYRWSPDHVVALLHAVGLIETTRLIENPEPDDRRQFCVAHILARKAPDT